MGKTATDDVRRMNKPRQERPSQPDLELETEEAEFESTETALPEFRMIVGLQPVREAIRAHGEKLRVLVDRKPSKELDAVARFAKDRGASVERVLTGTLDRLSRGVRHQGVLAEAPLLALRSIADLDLAKSHFFIALDEIEDPQNFGAIVRTSVALGASGVIWPENHSAPLSMSMFRASAGAVEHAVLSKVTSLPKALQELRDRGATVIGLDASAKEIIDNAQFDGPLVLVVGAEGKGLRKSVKESCDFIVSLAMRGPIASLNASVAVGIAMYSVARKL